jgi:2,4-dienoyl-CoA reductase-like NADH-dependent reductase (Old Yellow Enzyme family)/thioredoxin reductase
MNTNMANGDGTASIMNRDYYAERARGGAGLVILEAIFIEWAAKHRTFGMGVSEDKYIPGLAMVAKAIKDEGALAAAQINHNGRILSEDLTGLTTVAVSNHVNPATGELSVEMSGEEIQEMVEKYARAALRVRQAGFDAVEIHGAHGYLLAQFISPFTNHRTDQYGGPLINRMRMPLQVVRKVKSLCGPDFPVFYRLSANEYFQGGLTLEESRTFAMELEKAGVDLLDVSGSSLEGPNKLSKVIPCNHLPRGYHVPSATAMKKLVSIPVVGVGRINCPRLADDLIADGKLDMVAVGRQFIADPHWPQKAEDGREQDIRRCIACNVCLDILLANKGPFSCTVNPQVVTETDAGLKRASAKKKVAVVGAGPAGLEAARTAAVRGHEVVLLERAGAIGGQLNLAGVAPGKEDIPALVGYYQAQMEKLGIEVRLGVAADQAVLENLGPDEVVLATGAKPSWPEAEWVRDESVLTAWDVLSGQTTVGQRVIVVGGGRVGVETADYLLSRGHEVILVEKESRIGGDLGLTVRPIVMNRLGRASINVFNRSQVKAVEGQKVTVARDGNDVKLDGVDTIVLAMGVESENSLARSLSGGKWKLHTIGDCDTPEGIKAAVEAGFLLGGHL